MPEVRPRKQSIQRRFIVGLTIAMTITLLAFSAASLTYLMRATRMDLEAQLDRLVSLSHQSLSSALWQFNLEYVGDYIESLFLYRDVVYAQVTTDRTVVKTKIRDGYDHIDFRRSGNAPDYLIRERRIIHQNINVGAIRIAVTKDRIWDQVVTVSLVTVSLLLVSTALIAATAYGLFRKLIHTPIGRLERSAARIARGNLDAAIDTSGKGEI